MKKFTFGKSRSFAFAFAWNEAVEFGRKVKVEKVAGNWIVKVSNQRTNACN